MNSWSRKLAPAAMLVLLSISTQAAHAHASKLSSAELFAASSVSGKNDNGSIMPELALVSNKKTTKKKNEHRHLAGKAGKPEGGGAQPQQPQQHRKHHGGGGKHDTGSNGHHPGGNRGGNGSKANKPAAAGNPAPVPAPARVTPSSSSTTDAKSGKAVSSPTAHQVHAAATPFPTASNSEEYTNENASIASGKASKTELVGAKEGSYETADAGMTVTASGKSGKASYATDDAAAAADDDDDGVLSNAKSGKAIMSYSPGSDLKGGTTHGDVMAEAKSGKASSSVVTEASGSTKTKPKADKAPLTEYFVKEPVHADDVDTGKGSGGDSKSGKASATNDYDESSHSPTMYYSGKSGKATSGGSGAAKASKTMPGMSYDGDVTSWPEDTPQPTEMSSVVSPPTGGTPPPPVPSPPTPEEPAPSPTLPPVPAETPPPVPADTPPPVPVVETPAPVPSMPTDLDTLSPTLSNKPSPGTAESPDIVEEGPPDGSKYWSMPGMAGCLYNPGFPPDIDLFDTLEGCCESYFLEDQQPCLDQGPPTPVLRAPPAPRVDALTKSDDDEDDSPSPTYYPTADPNREQQLTNQEAGGEEASESVLQPFGVNLWARSAEPNWNEESIKEVTKEHLIHSFRTKDWNVEDLNLMVLKDERKLKSQAAAVVQNPITFRALSQHPEFELIFGGVLTFPANAEVPTAADMDSIVHDSFTGERLNYYMQLLQENGINVGRAKLANLDEPSAGADTNTGGSGFNWTGLAIGMSCSLVGIAFIAAGSRFAYKKKHRDILQLTELDLEKGDYAIRLKYTNDEIDDFPGHASTVADTLTDGGDNLSVPSLVRGEEQISFMASTPGTNSSRSTGSDSVSVSPMDSPHGISSSGASISSKSTRYVSVFTVKKDCGKKPLEEVDLRALAISYLSRMLKKFPNTHLLPYDKNASLPAITNIRNIPDDIEELKQYVGNPRIDEKTGKVLFNLRVESDEPVSKMKHGSSSRGGGVKKASSSKKQVTSVKSIDEMEQEEMPKSPGTFEDVNL